MCAVQRSLDTHNPSTELSYAGDLEPDWRLSQDMKGGGYLGCGGRRTPREEKGLQQGLFYISFYYQLKWVHADIW